LAGPVTVVIYDYYIGRVDYALASRQGFQTIQWSGGKLTDRYIGVEILTVHFMITEQSLQSMKAEGVPEDILRKLQGMKNQDFTGEVEFLRVLRRSLGVESVLKRKFGLERTRIGAERGFRYRSAILKYAVRRTPETCCRIKQIVESSSKGSVWLLGDWHTLTTDDRDYIDPSKEYLRSLIRTPDYWGLDGQTFAVKLRPPLMPGGGKAA
jgi:hypothetical protein